MKNAISHAAALMVLTLLVSCSKEPEPAILMVYHEGNEYSILERGDTYDEGKPAYLVRYLSEDPNNDVIREAECADLYAIVAKHLDTNKHERVVIEAVDQKGRLFGIMAPREVRERKSAEEVLAYKPEAKK
jgi:hypothetical protein